MIPLYYETSALAADSHVDGLPYFDRLSMTAFQEELKI